jgi:hypothetical protein
MRSAAARYWLTGDQRKLIDDAATKLPADERHFFQLRVAKYLHATVHGQASDASIRLSIKSATG